ncbi:inner membrane protein YbjM [Pluralibacter sp.]|uniref:inner membrane protein YbjM n=1 Tax=Pluralibacter sp. TaxID=1920032 RepID=UPI0025E62B03|nr:inner membrane protein YbjM [Pluralibacter sp.]MBV8044346.1 inner membrane protein YbjM [Pluralibacter sp.]
MKTERGWAGVICCFVLFIIVCLFLTLRIGDAFRTSGHSELGLLFFVIPGVIASVISPKRRLMLPLLGAVLAMPVCLLLMRLGLVSTRSFWQELAWLFSAVFWCGLGALFWQFIRVIAGEKRGRE